MIPVGEPRPSDVALSEASDGTALGKRYADDEIGIELLCTKAGQGDLFVDGARLLMKGAKPLPASD